MSKDHYAIFTDGAARSNPIGRGGYGTLILKYDNNGKQLSYEEFAEGFPIATNNQMEMTAVIIGLENIPEKSIGVVYSDSKYVVDAIEKKWINNWIKNGWKTTLKTDVKNKDLWQRMLALLSKREITFTWVKGHSGHVHNERCDILATAAADNKTMTKKDGKITIK